MLLSATLLAAGCQVNTDPCGRMIVSTPTPGQALGLALQHGVQPDAPRIMKVPQTPGLRSRKAAQDQRVAAGHTVQIVAAAGGHQVVVDGRVLATDTEDDRVMIEGVYSAIQRIADGAAGEHPFWSPSSLAGTHVRHSTKLST